MSNGNDRPKYNPDEWAISTIEFYNPKGVPLGSGTISNWAALGSSEMAKKTSVEEHQHHITLVYEAGDVKQRIDVAKVNCDIVRIPRKVLEEKLKARRQP